MDKGEGYMVLYALLFILLACFMWVTALRRRKMDRPGLLVMYVEIGICGLLTAGGILAEEFGYTKLYDRTATAVLVCIGAVIIQVFYMGLTHQGDKQSKKMIRIGLIIILCAGIPAGIVFLIDKIWN
ncbi:hypothetical protein [Paenibacillus sp. Leaf72]|uniref:hypothetical protein n=1 Tax=Paenibacillus sp. Leaf72 TaxID=1736234 RepID=UPI000A7C02E1|nr:hypothetical protein [Paenibacillus sp. Leaf72]